MCFGVTVSRYRCCALCLAVLLVLGAVLCAFSPDAYALEPTSSSEGIAIGVSEPSGAVSDTRSQKPSSSESGSSEDSLDQLAYDMAFVMVVVMLVLGLLSPPALVAVIAFVLTRKRRKEKRMSASAMSPMMAGPPMGSVPVDVSYGGPDPQAQLVKFSDEYVEQLARKYESADTEPGAPQ